MEFEVWRYSEGKGFPRGHPTFFQRHFKAVLVACATFLLGIAAITSANAGAAVNVHIVDFN